MTALDRSWEIQEVHPVVINKIQNVKIDNRTHK